MAGNLTESENLQLGGTAALIEGVLLQPTMYWKNAKAQRMPFTINPFVIYRGTGAALTNEVVQMSLQFLSTGFFKKAFGEKLSKSQEFFSATLGGAVVATAASPIELVMIQQQRYGGTMWGTPLRIARSYGFLHRGMMRGLTPAIARDSIYVSGFLGVTPLFQDYLMEQQGMGQINASFWASMVGGTLGAVLSHPFDCVKTCMQGDLEQKTYTDVVASVRQVWAEGKWSRLFDGCFWRTVNICLTVWIANECRVRLPPIMFGKEAEKEEDS